MEQVRGIEPLTSAWKAEVLPLNYTCNYIISNIGLIVKHTTEPYDV